MTQQAQAQPTLQDVLNAVNSQAQTINNQGQTLKTVQDAMQEMALWRRTAFSTMTVSGEPPAPQTQAQSQPATAGTAQQVPAQPQGPPELTITFKFWGATYTWNADGKFNDGHLALAARELAFYADKFIQQRWEASQRAGAGLQR